MSKKIGYNVCLSRRTWCINMVTKTRKIKSTLTVNTLSDTCLIQHKKSNTLSTFLNGSTLLLQYNILYLRTKSCIKSVSID